jgi:predicted MFS family arabinose efflux permease
VYTLLAGLTATVTTPNAFLGMRVVTALAASGVIPIALALVGDLVPYERRGQALGWIFGGMAGGMAFGAAGGALAEPHIGWQGLFVIAAGFGLVWLIVAFALKALPHAAPPEHSLSMRRAATDYLALFSTVRGRRTYSYIFINAVVQSGIYSWVGLFLHQRFAMNEIAIGLTLLGYGLPGFFLGPLIGRAVDRWGRARVIPPGVALTALCSFTLAAPISPRVAQAAIILTSLGYDMTQPPLAGIVTDLPSSRGAAMAFNAFTLFTGFGVGALLFQMILPLGFTVAFSVFGAIAAVAAVFALPLFRGEQPG